MAATRLPHAFGRYVLRERVAAGGMAEVFRGTLPGFGGFEKAVAIKRMYRQYSHDHSFVEMLSDEAKIVSQLAHPNIVHILDIGRVHDDYYIALEFIEGIDLFRLLQKQYEVGRDMSLAMALYIVAELCSALDYAHSRRTPDGQPMHIIHRDVSPQNVLISYLGEVKLTDFGIAKARYRHTQTQAGVVKGKIYYMSPEQARGGELDHRSDLFAVGILLYELLCTRPLYDEEEQARLITVVGKAEYEWPADKRARLPAQVIALCDRALHRQPAQRYQTGREFRSALLRVAEQLGHRMDREQFGAYVRKSFDIPDDRPPKVRESSVHDSTRDYSVLHWASQIGPVPTSSDQKPPTPVVNARASEEDSKMSESFVSEQPTPAVKISDAKQLRPGQLPRGMVPETEIANSLTNLEHDSDVRKADPAVKKKVSPEPSSDLPPPVPLPEPSVPAADKPKQAAATKQKEAAPDEYEEATAMLSLEKIQAAVGMEEQQDEPTAMLNVADIDAGIEALAAESNPQTKPAKKPSGVRIGARRGVPRRAAAPAATEAASKPEPEQSTRLQVAMAETNYRSAPSAALTSAGYPHSETAHAAPLPISLQSVVAAGEEPASWQLIGITAGVWSSVVVLIVYAIMLAKG
jgi:serine/threonine protein kinase